MSYILPAIIPERSRDLEAKVASVAREVDWVHIDMCDGKYVPSTSWPFLYDWNDFDVYENEEQGLPNWERLEYEIDLMVKNPKYVMERWIRAGASSFVVHAENLTDNFDEMVQIAHDAFAQIGIAFLPDTDISKYKDWIEKADFVHCMSIAKIGYQGQPFDERVFDQIAKVLEIKPDAVIAVDGHVDLDNIADLTEAGVTKFVIGSALYSNDEESIPQFIAEAKAIIHEASDIL